MPKIEAAELTNPSLGPQLVKAALVMGNAHLVQAWPQAKEWKGPAIAVKGTNVGNHATGFMLPGAGAGANGFGFARAIAVAPDAPAAPPAAATPFGDAPTGGGVSWPREPLRVATKRQASARPPPSFFESLRLRVSLEPVDGMRRMLTIELPPTVRTLSTLRRAAAEVMSLEEDAIEALLKLPDVLLAEDEDVLWLSDGVELQVWRRGVVSRGASRPYARPSRRAMLPPSSQDLRALAPLLT